MVYVRFILTNVKEVAAYRKDILHTDFIATFNLSTQIAYHLFLIHNKCNSL